MTIPTRTKARKLIGQCIAWLEGRSSEHAVTASGCWVAVTGVWCVTGASSLAGAGAVVCSVFLSLAGFWWDFCFVLEALAGFFATSFAFSSALAFFAAWNISSFAASSASKDVFWKFFGMSEVKPKVAE